MSRITESFEVSSGQGPVDTGRIEASPDAEPPALDPLHTE